MKTILFMLFFCIATVRHDPEMSTIMLQEAVAIGSSVDTNQVASLEGKVTDATTGEALIFANIILYKNGNLITGVQSDLDGNYVFSSFDPGTYDVEASYTGYTSQRQTGVVLFAGKANRLDFKMEVGLLLEEVYMVDYKVPLIEQDNTTQGGVKTGEQIRNHPVKNINAIAGYTAGVSSTDGREVNIRGSRNNATGYYIDGIDVSYNTEDYDVIVENSFLQPEDNSLSTFSIDVDRASYANVRRFITDGQVPPKDAVRIEEMVNYFDYDYDSPTGETPFTIFTEVGACPWEPKNKLVHIGLQGKKIPTENLPASNLVFLVDVSGSMDQPNKLPLVVSSFKILVEQLRQQDRVAIVVYAGRSGLVLPSTSGANKSDIIEVLDRLRAGGSTAGAQGIRQAYDVARENFISGGNNRVVLATDGDFNVGVSSDAELVEIIEKERESGVFLSVLGYGTGNYQDAKMQKLADHGNGNHGYVDNIEEARKVFVHEFGGTMFTIAKDVKIQIEFNPQHVAGYRLIGYENRLLNKEDFNDDKKDAGEMGSSHTVTALYEIIPVGVESDFLKSVDKLKYQKTKSVASANKSDELMHLKCRYKLPDDSTSKLLETSVLTNDRSFESCSANFRWSATVASFGMLLRESKYKGKVTFSDIENWAANAKGFDPNGYRKDFLDLVRKIGPVLEASAQK